MIWKPVLLSWTKLPPRQTNTYSTQRNAGANLIPRYNFSFIINYHHFTFCNKQHTFPDTLCPGYLACPMLLHFKWILNTVQVTGHRKSYHPFLKPYPQCTLAFFKLISLLIKCLSTNSAEVFPNHWLSFVILTTQKLHPRIKQSFACLTNLKELCPRFILLFDALNQNYFKDCLPVERLFCRS